MRTIAIANQKGGAGKTTTTVNLAAALAERGQAVLIVDLDPQASASAWLGIQDEAAGEALLQVLTEGGELTPLARPSSAERVEVIASSLTLTRAEVALRDAIGGEHALRELLAGIPAGRWDFVLIDCPPALGRLTACALAAAPELLVPCEISALSLAGLAALRKTVTAARRRLNPELSMAVLPCRVDNRTRLSRALVERLERDPELHTLRTRIRESIKAREAPASRQSLLTYAPESGAAEDYRSLAAELLEKRI